MLEGVTDDHRAFDKGIDGAHEHGCQRRQSERARENGERIQVDRQKRRVEGKIKANKK
jgi:hypothetical protein